MPTFTVGVLLWCQVSGDGPLPGQFISCTPFVWMSSLKAVLSTSALANNPYTARDGPPWSVFCPQSTMASVFAHMLFGFGVVGTHVPLGYPAGSVLSSLLWASLVGVFCVVVVVVIVLVVLLLVVVVG